jgi:hypothetical protein
MSAYIDASIVIAVVAFASAFMGVLTWIYKRGRVEGNFEKSLQDNSAATRELTTVVGGLKDSLSVGFKEVHDRIDNHDIEIAVAKRDIQHLAASMIVAVAPLPPAKT